FVALGLGLVAFALVLRFALRRVGLAKRPILLGGMILVALPAFYVCFTWAALLSDSYLRLARPWVTLLLAGATAFIAVRLCQQRAKQGPWRAALGDLLTMAAAITAAMA